MTFSALRAQRHCESQELAEEFGQVKHADFPAFNMHSMENHYNLMEREDTRVGTVKLRQLLADWPDEHDDTELPRIPIPSRDHQPRGLALAPVLSEFSRRRGPLG